MIIADDKTVPWHPGLTVKELLDQLEHTRFCSAVRLNGKLVSSPNFDTTPVPDNSIVQLLPLVAGG